MQAMDQSGHAIDAGYGMNGFRMLLDAIDEEDLRSHFPAAVSHCERYGVAMDNILIRPFLHYQLGGFEVGRFGASDIPGVRLAGEMVGGLHGQNRLMGNGLTDSLVNGFLAGRAAVGA